MIVYFPKIYQDELFYSAVARYYSHLYPTYSMAIEDLCKTKTSRIDFEFGLKPLNEETRLFLDKTYELRNILLNHTAFSQYAMFETLERRGTAEKILLSGEGDVQSFLRFSKNSKKFRYLRYCPLCFEEEKEKLGEAYWHRLHQISGIDICSKHGCYLRETEIEISSKSSPRLWVADDIVVKTPIDYASDKEKQFTNYVVSILQLPIPKKQPPISEWLISRLEGTQYISSRGKSKHICKLFNDLNEYYTEFGCTGIEKKHKLEKIFTGYNNNFLDICKLLFFLKVPIEDVENPRMPEKTQTERFNEEVEQLKKKGLRSSQIAKKLGSSKKTVLTANCQKVKETKSRNYANRKGIRKQNWEKMDDETLPKVKELCEKIYNGVDGKPKKVTTFVILKMMGWPDKRLDYLPKCRRVIQEYSKESMEEYWAREIVYFYLKLHNEGELINWRKLRDLTNMKRKNFEKCMKYLTNYTDDETAEAIKNLI